MKSLILTTLAMPTRQNTSLTRQEIRLDKGAWSALSKHYLPGSRRPVHQHATAQLVFSTEGIMEVETDTRRWTVLPQRALWVPPAQDHAIEVLSATELRTVYFNADLVAQCPEFSHRFDVHALEASALVKQLVLSLFEPNYKSTTQQHMVKLLLHTLGEAVCAPTYLPLPRDRGLRSVVRPLLERHQWQRTVDHLAADMAQSTRTFTRHFTADVGMSFRAWRQQARLLASLNMLAADIPIKAIATQLCFSSSSAYVSAFREAFGRPPEMFRKNLTGEARTQKT